VGLTAKPVSLFSFCVNFPDCYSLQHVGACFPNELHADLL
jgi:hypothetical protein